MRPPRPQVISRKGFTLVELLAVIGIVGVLAGIVLAVIGNVRQRASMAVSRSNLGQLGHATLLFAADNHMALPVFKPGHPCYWVDALWKVAYPDRPAVPSLPPSPDTYANFVANWGGTIFYSPLTEDQPVARSYGYNIYLNQFNESDQAADPLIPLRTTHITNPSRTVLIADSSSVTLTPLTIKARNAGFVYCVFADAHVKPLRPPDPANPLPSSAENRIPYNKNATFWRGVSMSGAGAELPVW
ncbi:MAG TPA: type II secretion system protein [Rariglobus sp.]